jgi:hypothetical protein
MNMYKRRRAPIAAGIATLTIGATIAIFAPSGGAASSASTGDPGYAVSVPDGVHLHLSPEGAASAARTQMSADTVITNVTAVSGLPAVHAVEPSFGTPGPAIPDIGPVWIVRGKGLFVGHFGPANGPAPHAASGYEIVVDSTGAVIGMGMP